MSKFTTLQLCVTGLLAALSVVFNAISITIGNDISITFTYLVSFVAGVFLGPVMGFSVGIIGDVVGCIIAPKGPYMITVTLSSGLMGVLPWLVFYFLRKLPKYLKIVLSFVLVFLVCTVAINTTTWYIVYNSKSEYLVYLFTRSYTQGIVVVINAWIMCLLYNPFEKLFRKFRVSKLFVPYLYKE